MQEGLPDLQGHRKHVQGSLDMHGPAADDHSGAPQGVSAMRDGAVWSSCDDALLGMGLLKWGQNHAAIVADLLPGYTPSQVAQRLLERTHRNRAANPVKVGSRVCGSCTGPCIRPALQQLTLSSGSASACLSPWSCLPMP
jgi:hypothetical protein